MSFWKCQCRKCNKITSIKSSDIDKLKSCGCLKGKITNHYKPVEIGDVYGRLTVIDFYEKTKRGREFKCLCSCGKEKNVPENYLKKGITTSCGCLRRERVRESCFKDLTGQEFGKLTVLKLDKERSKETGKTYYVCQCNCENKTILSVWQGHLNNGHTSSCGCITSRGEVETAKILNKLNIKFKPQYSFNDLIGIGNGLLRFDFAVFDDNNNLKGCIEFNGIQHYKEVKLFGGKEHYDYYQEHDKRKKEYCLKNNIPLLILTQDVDIEESILKWMKTWKTE